MMRISCLRNWLQDRWASRDIVRGRVVGRLQLKRFLVRVDRVGILFFGDVVVADPLVNFRRDDITVQSKFREGRRDRMRRTLE